MLGKEDNRITNYEKLLKDKQTAYACVLSSNMVHKKKPEERLVEGSLF